MKKILVIQGHPDNESFNQALFDRYVQEMRKTGNQIKLIELGKLEFNPNLAFGYRKRTELEPDLIEAQKKLKWAEHIVLFFPLWWGSMPALLKGFFDRVLLPGFAFTKKDNSIQWTKHMKGRSARMIVTMDQPPIYFRLAFSRPAYHSVKQMTFRFIGIHKVRYTPIGTVRSSSESKRKLWLERMQKLAKKDA